MNNSLRALQAFTDETRLRIINLLYERELCVCDLEVVLGTTQTKISRHLAHLRNADLVGHRKIAQWSFYSLQGTGLMKFVDELVLGVLRKEDIYRKDLELLKKKAQAGVCQTDIALKRRNK